MLKKLFLASFLFSSLIGVSYPLKKENTRIFEYCYSLEKIFSKNSIETKENLSGRIKSISKDISRLGVSKTKGLFINKIIDKYKKSKNSFVINSIHNEIYCLAGYWIEYIKPGTFESIFYEKSEKKINEIKELKIEVDGLINDFNSEYKILKKEFKNFF
tara:strand:- start:8070 stop:8546 length:477 start_codon:yes stop_codon:yes gene_type:complete